MGVSALMRLHARVLIRLTRSKHGRGRPEPAARSGLCNCDSRRGGAGYEGGVQAVIWSLAAREAQRQAAHRPRRAGEGVELGAGVGLHVVVAGNQRQHCLDLREHTTTSASVMP